MSAYCRICNDTKQRPDSDTYIACNNCGSFACTTHYVWWKNSRNAFCTVCFPGQAADGTNSAIQALQAIVRNANSNAEGVREIYEAVSAITRDFRDMKIEDLIELLNRIRTELTRRGQTT